MSLIENERASSGAFVNFLLILIASGILAWILRKLTLPLITKGQSWINPADSISQTALAYQTTFIMYWAVCAFFTACFYLLTTSIVERRVSV